MYMYHVPSPSVTKKRKATLIIKVLFACAIIMSMVCVSIELEKHDF